MTARERILAAAKLQAETGGCPSTIIAPADVVCALMGWTPEDLAADLADPAGSFVAVDRSEGF